MTTLDPCPFCGGEASLVHGDRSRMFSVECGQCGVEGPKRIVGDAAEAAWNRRALSSLPAQAVGDGDFTERLREAAYRDTAKSVTVSAADLRAHLEATQRYVLNRLAPSQPATVGERADALWEQLLPLMQVEECPPGDPYKDKVAALALIEAALRSTP